MSRLTFVLGGARSGKSRYAQALAADIAGDGAAVYIATAQLLDDEMRDRAAMHRSERPAHWVTLEEPLDVAGAVGSVREAPVILIDCLTLLVTNHLLKEGDPGACMAEAWDEADVDLAVESLIFAAQESESPVILVSNEVGMGLVPETPLGRVFRDVAGRANQRVAAAADEVVFMVAGIPLTVKCG